MGEKKERSYAKESAKSTPSGIRFDLDKLAFVQKRENLPTKQKVVDFLLNEYWWKWKVPTVTAKEVPPMGLKTEVKDEPLSFDAMKANLSPVPAANNFYREMDAAEDLQELEAIGRKIKASGMSWKEQAPYHAYGQNIARKKFTD